MTDLSLSAESLWSVPAAFTKRENTPQYVGGDGDRGSGPGYWASRASLPRNHGVCPPRRATWPPRPEAPCGPISPAPPRDHGDKRPPIPRHNPSLDQESELHPTNGQQRLPLSIGLQAEAPACTRLSYSTATPTAANRPLCATPRKLERMRHSGAGHTHRILAQALANMRFSKRCKSANARLPLGISSVAVLGRIAFSTHTLDLNRAARRPRLSARRNAKGQLRRKYFALALFIVS